MALACQRMCRVGLEVAEDRLDPGVPLLRCRAVIAKRSRLGEQALEPFHPGHRKRTIGVLEPVGDLREERRSRGDRGELDDARTVTMLALIDDEVANRACEATSRTRLAKPPNAIAAKSAEKHEMPP
jgi:hypothetical protein